MKGGGSFLFCGWIYWCFVVKFKTCAICTTFHKFLPQEIEKLMINCFYVKKELYNWKKRVRNWKTTIAQEAFQVLYKEKHQAVWWIYVVTDQHNLHGFHHTTLSLEAFRKRKHIRPTDQHTYAEEYRYHKGQIFPSFIDIQVLWLMIDWLWMTDSE